MAREAARHGWASGGSSLEALRAAALRLGWEPVELRSGDHGVTKLAPVTPEQAPARSHSALVGTGSQPLHTDGAHRRRPPRWIVLHSEQPNLTPTSLCRLRSPLSGDGGISMPLAAAKGGIFIVDAGPDRFLATLYTESSGWRWDPDCMTPSDQRAREAMKVLSQLSNEAVDHEWVDPNQFLLIDNWQVLHARGDATGDMRRQLSRLAFTPGDQR